jgi:hypothetical protein
MLRCQERYSPVEGCAAGAKGHLLGKEVGKVGLDRREPSG